MARTKNLGGYAIEQHTSPNRGGRMSGTPRGIVLHIAEGYYQGTISWQMNPDQRYADGTRVTTSSTWIVGRKTGEWAQMVDTEQIAWAQRGGSTTWHSIELVGFAPQAPSAWQVEACAQLLAWHHHTYGTPVEATGSTSGRGLGHHSMDNDTSVQWGHDACPGSGVIGAKSAIVKRAKEIVEGDDVSAKDVWSHRIAQPQWIKDRWNVADNWRASSLLRSAYGHARSAKDWTRDYGREILAGQAAILAQAGGEDVAAAVRAELARAAERERAERADEQGELEELLQEAAAERTALAALVAQAQSGELDAAEVVNELGRRLAAESGD